MLGLQYHLCINNKLKLNKKEGVKSLFFIVYNSRFIFYNRI